MNIDYDAIQYDRDCTYAWYTRELIDDLVTAMRDGEITKAPITYEWAICDECEGEGSHSRHLGVIDHETWNDWQDDERASYLNGRYDRACIPCHGSGKVKELNYDILPDDVRAWIDNYFRVASECANENYYERLAGC